MLKEINLNLILNQSLNKYNYLLQKILRQVILKEHKRTQGQHQCLLPLPTSHVQSVKHSKVI